MNKLDPNFKINENLETEAVNLGMIFNPNDYGKKVNEIKAAIDKLLREKDDETIDILYRLMVKRTKAKPATPQELQEIFDKFDKHE